MEEVDIARKMRRNDLMDIAGEVEKLRDRLVHLARHESIRYGMTRSDGHAAAERCQVFISGLYRESSDINQTLLEEKQDGARSED